MDFVASRADEQKHGWRNRVGDFLARLRVTKRYVRDDEWLIWDLTKRARGARLHEDVLRGASR
jgi:hypothetical protein